MTDPWVRYGIAGRPATPLRLGLLLDDARTLPAWAARSVRRLLDSGTAELVVVVISSGPPRAPLAQRLGAFALARATVWRAASLRSVPLAPLLATRPTVIRLRRAQTGHAASPDAREAARIRDARPDVFLSLGPGAPRVDGVEARHGIWSFVHGGAGPDRGGPPAFWELFDKAPDISVVLQRATAEPAEGEVLRRAVLAVEPHSYRRTVDQVLEAAADLPLQVCRDLLVGREVGGERVPPPGAGRPGPDVRAVARVLASTLVANLRRLLYGAFVLKQWSIGRLDGGVERILRGDLHGARWLRPAGRTRMYADPMIVPGTRGRVVLCEALDFVVGRGMIARVEVDDDATATTPWLQPTRVRRVAALPIHLSFPTVIDSGDGLVVIPEAARSGGLLTARLADDATSAIDFQSAPGMEAVDPVAFRHGDRWWLACTERGPTARSHLWLFHGPGPRGPWAAHPRNPVVIDAGSARAAGLPFLHEGALYRPAQDGRQGYGRAIRIMRVRTLTPEDYAEDLVVEIGPDPRGPYGLGVHTVSVEGETIWIDGYRAVIHPLAGWFRIRARQTSGATVGRRVGGWPS